MSTRPSRDVDSHYKSCIATTIRADGPYLSGMWEGFPQGTRRSHASALLSQALDATREYHGDLCYEMRCSPEMALSDHDGTEPLRSYMVGWVAGYVMRALDGSGAEADIREFAAKRHLHLPRMQSRLSYAQACCVSQHYSSECLSMTAGRLLMSWLVEESPGEDIPGHVEHYSWKGDAEGFADGWTQARREGLGHDRPIRAWTDEKADAVAQEEQVVASFAPTPIPPESVVPTLTAAKTRGWEALFDQGVESEVASNRQRRFARRRNSAIEGLPGNVGRHVRRCVSASLRENVDWLRDMTDAGLSYIRAKEIDDLMVTMTATYARKEMGIKGSVVLPRNGDEDPVRSYASGWLRGYASVMTDGDRCESAIRRLAASDPNGDLAIVLEADRPRMEERIAWEGLPAEATSAAFAHAIASHIPHGSGYPLDSHVASLPSYSLRGDCDGFADGWGAANAETDRIEDETGAEALEMMIGDGRKSALEASRRAMREAQEARRRSAVRVVAGLWPGTRLGMSGDEDDWGDDDDLMDEMDRDFLVDSDTDSMLTPQFEIDARASATSALAKMRDKIVAYSSRCVAQAISDERDHAKMGIIFLGMDEDSVREWGDALVGRTVAHAMPVATPSGWLPVVAQDGTDPIRSYAFALVAGWADGVTDSQTDIRSIAEVERRWRIRLGDDFAAKAAWVRETCFSIGAADRCVEATLARSRWVNAMLDERNSGETHGLTRGVTDWRHDVRGYADGWMMGFDARGGR